VRPSPRRRTKSASGGPLRATPPNAPTPTVHTLLAAAGVEYRLHAHRPAVSFADALEYLSFDPRFAVKALAFRLPDGGYALVGLRGADRADYKAIADALGIRRADLRLAEAADVERDLGVEPGGVAPLPFAGATVLLDRRVVDLEIAYCGAGRSDMTLEIAPGDLMRLGAQVGDFAR